MARMKTMNSDGAHRLTFEIVNRACDDYVMLKRAKFKGHKGHIVDGKIVDIDSEINRIVRFFKSEWYAQLMPNIDPNKLIEKLDFKAMIVKSEEEREEEKELTNVYE